jgi:hypothetical protein
MPIRSKLLLPALMLGLTGSAQAAEECATAVQCNQAGSAAYQAGRYEQAIEAFERQLRRVEGSDTAQFELALNNLILTHLRAGDAGMARAWLEVALDNNLSGSSTRLHLTKVAEALDYQALAASPATPVFQRCAPGREWRNTAQPLLVGWRASWKAMQCKCVCRMLARTAIVRCSCCVKVSSCVCWRCSRMVARTTAAWGSVLAGTTSR